MRKRIEDITVDKFSFHSFKSGLGDRVVVWTALHGQRTLYTEGVKQALDLIIFEFTYSVGVKQTNFRQIALDRCKCPCNKLRILVLTGAETDDTTPIKVEQNADVVPFCSYPYSLPSANDRRNCGREHLAVNPHCSELCEA